MAYYLDTSALVKLVVTEAESASLRAWITKTEAVAVSSDLARTELARAVRRGSPHATGGGGYLGLGGTGPRAGSVNGKMGP